MRNTHTPEVVVITGASAGLGRAIAQAFAKRGASIGLIARGKAGLEGAKADVEHLGGSALAIPCDVADAAAVERAADEVERTFGPIDVWVNNAMASVFSPVAEMQPDEYKRVTEVTYLGQVYGTLAALKRMKPRDAGTIVLVGSALAYRGIPLQSAYCASKHAIQGFFDSLRAELVHDKSNIHACMVQMPGMNTTQFEWVKSRMPGAPKPIGQIYQPEVAAEAVYWAAHSRRREVYVGYPVKMTVMGNKAVPAVGDWYLGKNGWEGQYEGAKRDRPNNLYEPVDEHEDHGAHGRFDEQSMTWSPQLIATKNRKWLALGAAAATGLALSTIFANGKRG